jgi:polyisoprenoid-binding protein YceI
MFSAQAQTSNEHVLKFSHGTISFASEAPLELIQASTKEFQAVIDTVSGKFAFSIPITSFVGFNSPLQQEHFNENYLESVKYPKATYTGKIIEAWQKPTSVARKVRTKGKLTIHGQETEQLINAVMQKEGKLLYVKSTFKVKTADYNIRIPKLVVQKIAQEIDVTVDVYFKLQ